MARSSIAYANSNKALLLTVSNMEISDLSPLYGLGRLRRVTIGSGSLGYGELDALRRELPDCEVVS